MGKKSSASVRGTSPRNCCWDLHQGIAAGCRWYITQELLDIFMREEAIGNRVGGTFTPTAYKNIVEELNTIFTTQIHKNHVQNKLRLLKTHYAQFKNAFASMSGFAWNTESKRFEAEDEVWATLLQNPSYAGLRLKTIHNWDKLDLLFGTTTTTGSMSHSGRDMYQRINRHLDVDSVYPHIGIFGRHNCNPNHKTTQMLPVVIITPMNHTAPNSGSHILQGSVSTKGSSPTLSDLVWIRRQTCFY